MPGFLILFLIIALSNSGVDISARYDNSIGPKYQLNHLQLELIHYHLHKQKYHNLILV